MLDNAFTFDKLLLAHKKCRLSKQHKKETISFEINLSQNLTELSKKLQNKTFKIGKYKLFYVYQPKKRKIEALSYKDRVVLMAFCTNVLEPKLEGKLIYDNVACRKGKGTFFGIERLEKFLHQFYKAEKSNQGYFLKCDMTKYFQSIDHKILRQKLSKALDEDELWFIDKLLESRYHNEGVGLPIGNQTSQWFGLYYLNDLDRFIKEKLQIKFYVRYMDDMILVHKDKEYLKYCKRQIEKLAAEELHLSLNNKTQIGQLKNGIDFLGFRHILGPTGKVVKLLRGQMKLRVKKKIKFLSHLDKENEAIKIRIKAYEAHLSHGNTYKFYKNLKKRYGFDNF